MTRHLALLDQPLSPPDAGTSGQAARTPARDASSRASRRTAQDPGSALVVMCAVLVSLAPLAAVEAMLAGMLAGLLVGSARAPELLWSAVPLIFLPCIAGAISLRSGARGLRWWWVLPAASLGLLGLAQLTRAFFG